MLMYRQVNSERNAKFLDQCDMPRHIMELMYKLRQQEEMERRRKEMDRCMCKVRVVNITIILASKSTYHIDYVRTNYGKFNVIYISLVFLSGTSWMKR